MNTGDAYYIKNLNRKIIIEHILREKSLSRSELARWTGLNKATVSSQVSSMLEAGIIQETRVGDLLTPGRKPILIEMNEKGGYSLGIDIDHTIVRAVFIDYKGKPFFKKKLEIPEAEAPIIINEVIEILRPLIQYFNDSFTPRGLIGICIGFHGILDIEGRVVFTPKEKWADTDIKQVVKSKLDVPTYIDNNANLSAYGEQVYFENIPDMLCITLYSGIGLGIINNYRIYRGFKGFAGEIGHMIVHPDGDQCSCGNKGCWELYASEQALVKQVANHFTSSEDRPIQNLLTDTTFNYELDRYLTYLGIGLNNIVNIFNPQRIVLNGAIINENPIFIREVKKKLISKMNSYEEIRFSHLGEYACAIGGAAYAIKKYLNVNTLNFVKYNYFTGETCEESLRYHSIC
ncbi:ROK family transcriptional regulator [Halobacillus sp. Marseille-P3879]|uniref:ROK family transcriptional regulator n=1 Tax=Halobacillus sp. Marseille-P3879 TaxID=2045014 RepID=UPI000C7D1C0F|nr:ROK family transcriptional regulator [Halobacillus sp. Marseille-P3879]